jgi:hypothetical protein
MKMKLNRQEMYPGLFCVENFTLFVIIVLLMIIVYMYVSYSRRNGVCVWRKRKRRQTERDSREHPAAPSVPNDLSNLTTRLKSEPPVVGRSYKHPDAPANGLHTDRDTDEIRDGRRREHNLPLFGKRSDVSRSKYQYYTMSNTGVVNTKPRSTRTGSVPASRCDEIYSGDRCSWTDSTFNAKVYETNLLRYIPGM